MQNLNFSTEASFPPNDTESKQNGRWTKEEHLKFIEGVKLYGKNWKKIQEVVKTRNGSQIRSHAQKFFNKLSPEINALQGDKFLGSPKNSVIINSNEHSLNPNIFNINSSLSAMAQQYSNIPFLSLDTYSLPPISFENGQFTYKKQRTMMPHQIWQTPNDVLTKNGFYQTFVDYQQPMIIQKQNNQPKYQRKSSFTRCQ